MYTVPAFVPKVYLIHRDGRRWEYKNIEIAANDLFNRRFLGYYRIDPVGTHFNEVKYYDYIPENEPYKIITYDYIVRDELGTIITCNELRSIRDKSRPVSRWSRRYISQTTVTKKHFRNSPIPYTGKRGGWKVYRTMHTTPEHRENDFLNYDEDALEYNIKARPSRRKYALPTSWDDSVRSDYNCKSWKKHRKHQWKEKS